MESRIKQSDKTLVQLLISQLWVNINSRLSTRVSS